MSRPKGLTPSSRDGGQFELDVRGIIRRESSGGGGGSTSVFREGGSYGIESGGRTDTLDGATYGGSFHGLQLPSPLQMLFHAAFNGAAAPIAGYIPDVTTLPGAQWNPPGGADFLGTLDGAGSLASNYGEGTSYAVATYGQAGNPSFSSRTRFVATLVMNSGNTDVPTLGLGYSYMLVRVAEGIVGYTLIDGELLLLGVSDAVAQPLAVSPNTDYTITITADDLNVRMQCGAIDVSYLRSDSGAPYGLYLLIGAGVRFKDLSLMEAP